MTHAFVQSPLSSHQRYKGLLYGALVADALALGAHWLYDQNEIAGRFGRVAEFLPPARDDYHPGKLRGAQTHYGDQTLVLLESLDACDGNFVMEDFAQRWSWFWRESKAYRDHATKITLARLEESFDPPRAGSDSTDLGGAGAHRSAAGGPAQREPADEHCRRSRADDADPRGPGDDGRSRVPYPHGFPAHARRVSC
jgi:ADP-ribosylglycohydrolase